jgi:hypothetical protein
LYNSTACSLNYLAVEANISEKLLFRSVNKEKVKKSDKIQINGEFVPSSKLKDTRFLGYNGTAGVHQPC